MHRAQQSPPCEQIVDDAADTEKSLGLRARLKRRIWCSRWRVGWWETSARLFALAVQSLRKPHIDL